MSFSSPSRKRTADHDVPQNPSSTSSAPVILDRHHHRRRNIAIDTWGLDAPSDSPTATVTHANIPASTNTANTSLTNQPTANPVPFNIYSALLHHPSLFPHFISSLPLPSLLSLYAISKELHYLFNLYSLSLIHLYARTHFPVSSRVFSAALYPQVCISDPMLRPMDGREWLARDVPGLRWLGMIEYREGVVGGIIERLRCEGHALPQSCEEALYKLWGLIDMPSTPIQLAYLQDNEIWTDANILSFHLFLVKLDMRFSHPMTGNGGSYLSHLLLTQNSLTILSNILTGKVKLDYEKVELLIRRTYWSEDLDTDTYEWLLDADDTMVPEMYWGVMMREGRETGGEKMESVVDMVIEEGVRRELHCQERVLEFVMDGDGDGDCRRKMARENKKGGGKGKEKERKRWPSKAERNEAIASLNRQLGLIKIEKGEGEGGEGMDLSV